MDRQLGAGSRDGSAATTSGEQDHISHQVAKNIKKKLYQQNLSRAHDIRTKKEDRIMKQIRNKLIKNKAMVSKADKGNSIVILCQD